MNVDDEYFLSLNSETSNQRLTKGDKDMTKKHGIPKIRTTFRIEPDLREEVQKAMEHYEIESFNTYVIKAIKKDIESLKAEGHIQ